MTVSRFKNAIAALASAGCATASAMAGVTNWTFDIATEGEDVVWTSPTAVDPSAPLYDITATLTLIEVEVVYLGLPFGPIDVTNEIPKENRTIADIVQGPCPIVFLSDTIVYPEPPEPPAIEGDLEIGIDASGFGYASFTNVTLGQLDVDLGPPFGVVTVELTSVRIVGDVSVEPIPFPEDLNDDGIVNADDLFQLLGAWGDC